MAHKFAKVDDAIEAISRGEVVIVVDAEDRENEGDFICAADKVTPETMNFILSGRGQLCVSVLPDVCQRLKLNPLCPENTAARSTAFMTPVDHRSSKTGITAHERAHTIRAMMEPWTAADEFVRPGHVHPLLAKEGGVLRRAGHTEASMDLARWASLTPAGVLCEILDQQGDRASREELSQLAREQKLKIVSIEQLIDYAGHTDKLVSRAAEANLPTKYGQFKIIVYNVWHESQQPVALVLGDVTQAAAPLVRMHSSCFTGDLIDSLRCDCGDQLQLALSMIGRDGVGTVVYLPQEGRGIGLAEKIKAYALQEQGLDTVEANHALGFQADLRDYGVGIQILKDLGLSRMRLLTNNPKKVEAIRASGCDLTIVDQVPILTPPNCHSARYLAAKRDKLGHRLPAFEVSLGMN
jgi:3,4-dihydroxy 2-butanone 4-phosphate synthase/GTP cyclohydrolase II